MGKTLRRSEMMKIYKIIDDALNIDTNYLETKQVTPSVRAHNLRSDLKTARRIFERELERSNGP